MPSNQNPTNVRDLQTSYHGEVESMSADERAWMEAEIDKGLASPIIADRTVQQIMAEIRTKNRAQSG
jgi:hypothetical protein